MVSKLQRIERELSRKKGSFALFGLFLREDVSDRWDLLVAAPWMEGREVEAVRLIASKLTKELETEELLRISRIIPLSVRDPEVERIASAIHVEHGNIEITNCNFFGLWIPKAVLITSCKQDDSDNTRMKSVKTDIRTSKTKATTG